MSVYSGRAYWVSCDADDHDGDKCGDTIPFVAEFTLPHNVPTFRDAVEKAADDGWVQVDLGVWHCPAHAEGK